MTPKDALELGRVSNLPTVWTNMLAAIALVGGAVRAPSTLPLVVALTLSYVGGMYLNDAFDAPTDAAERPERPIPAGRVSRSTVFALGFAMLAASVLLLAWIGTWPAIAGLALAATIVLYNWWHKANPVSPVIMGACRFLVYVTAGLVAAAWLPAPLLIGGALLLCYVIGLTYVAKQETLGRVESLWPLLFLATPLAYGAMLAQVAPLAGVMTLLLAAWIGYALWLIRRRGPGDIPRAVVSLIAGISLYDAMLIAGTGNATLTAAALIGFVLTLALQRFVSGT